MAHALRSIPSGVVERPASGEVYASGSVRVDVPHHVVSRDGQPIALAPKTFESLIILVRSGGACCRGRDV